MTMQSADVTKALGSVYRWVKAKNMVVFDEDSEGVSTSYIYNKVTGAVTAMPERNGAYGFDMWVPRAQDSGPNTGRYQALLEGDEEEEAEDSKVFSGRDRYF